ncbi:MAG TPA: AAA family ATPase [Candidatus Dormibacteraeota bacterium]|nr:AAA family ATPase [Candidatus Dormibacteraeota bacterium]
MKRAEPGTNSRDRSTEDSCVSTAQKQDSAPGPVGGAGRDSELLDVAAATRRLSPEAVDAYLESPPLPGSPAWEAEQGRPSALRLVEQSREIVLTAASTIKPRPVKWLEDPEIPLGALTLLAGREGIGKSIAGCEKAARVTRGQLPGAYLGVAKGVIICATEDSWEHTIVPRLMAAGADLDRIFRVDVTTPDGVDTSLSLPTDLLGLERVIDENDVALVLLDPLMSRLDDGLDTHRDAEVRRALEPLVAVAERTSVSVLALIHVSKASTTDPLTSLMGSRAFAAVARAVIYMALDPDDAETRLIGQPKNNLGRSDLPTRSCRIEGVKVIDTEEGEVWTGKLCWTGSRPESIRDVLEAASESADIRSATGEAAGWLEDWLTGQGGSAASAAAKVEGKLAGHSIDALKRATNRLAIKVSSEGFPRTTTWSLPVGASPLGHTPTAPTAPTAGGRLVTTSTTLTDPQSAQSAQLAQSAGGLARARPNGRSHLESPAAPFRPDEDGIPTTWPDGSPYSLDRPLPAPAWASQPVARRRWEA